MDVEAIQFLHALIKASRFSLDGQLHMERQIKDSANLGNYENITVLKETLPLYPTMREIVNLVYGNNTMVDMEIAPTLLPLPPELNNTLFNVK